MTLPLLDRAHLAQYTAGDRALEAELFQLFASQIDACLDQMKTATDPENWSRAAHTLKGASRGVGAMRLGQVCEDIEAHPGSPSMQALSDAATKTLEALAETKLLKTA